MCYNNSNNIKRRSAEIEPRFYVNATCITKKSFMKYIKGEPREDYNPTWPKPHAIPHPKPNIYYPFTEDTNPFERVNIPDDDELIFKNQRFDPPREPFKSRDPYSDLGATAKYLETKPTCFAIFSKPGLNTSKLAGMISNAWNCVLISAMPLIHREMELRTEEGLRIKEKLESGGFVGHDIVMSLIRSRLKMRDVRHKGYVVEGLPLIPNENLDFSTYFNDTNDSCLCEESSSCEAKENSASYEEEIPKQVDEIFKEWCMPPSVIIYVTSPDEDIIEKRKYIRLDVSNGDIVDTTLTEMNANLERLISQTDIVNVGPISFNPYEELMNEERILDQDRDKHLVKRISDTRTCNIERQCHVYKQIALPVINKWILLYNPQNVIRVDGRMPISRMLQIINARLRLLPIPRVIVPHKMLDENEIELGGESGEVNIENEFEDMSMEEVYRELMQRGTINPRFPWRLSPFAYVCPVELALGRTVDGFFKYATRFMNKIYFLSSQRATDLFTENPRLFLLPPYPRPVCKIVVFGPIYSGKSVLCRELSRTFGATLINVKEKEQSIVDERQNAKITRAMREKLDGVISDLKHSLESERELRESRRQIELQSWYEKMLPVVTRLFELLNDDSTSSDSSDSEDEEPSRRKELESLRKTLRLFQLENIEKNMLVQDEINADNRVLLNYAPEYLAVEEPPVRELTEFDPEVLDILEDRVKYLYDEPINLSVSEKADVIIESINNIAGDKIDEDLLKDPCYIVDGMYTDLEVWKKVIDSNIIFDHIIVLLDEDPFVYLINKFMRYNEKLPDNEDVDCSEENSINETRSKRKMMSIAEYIGHLKQFESHWKLLEDKVKIAVKNHIICHLPDLNDISQYVVSELEKPFTVKATIMSDEDKERYKEFYEFENLLLGAEEDLEEGNEEKDLKPEDNSKENYPLGESGIYCPVALMKYNVFWKGSEDFSVSYMDKLYFLSTEEAMEEFVKNPRDFSIPYSTPARTIPPLRISVVGVPGSGKSTLCDSLSREYGMTHVDYYDCFTKYTKNRAMSYFTQKDTLIVEELAEATVLPEDLEDRSYNDDSKTVQYFIRQYWENGDTLPDKMLKECLLDFFRPPFHTRGIIFDGFPSCAEDTRLAFEKFAVPEVVIELRCSMESCIERMVPFVMEYWNMKEEKKRQLEQRRHAEEMEDYLSRREIWIRKMLQDREDQRRVEEREEQDVEYMDSDDIEIEVKKASSALLKQFLSEEVDLNFDVDDDIILELVELWKSENPEPEFIFDSEDFEDVKERVTNRLQVLYNNETVKLEGTRATFEGETIPWIEVDTEKDSNEIRMEVMGILDSYVFRDASMLERSYTVDCELAERLLDNGYYLLSSFGRWCPVQLYNKENPTQMFLPLEVQHEIWPVIYRQHIYFLGGKEAETAFRKNPLKYLEQDSCSPIIPLRISIIGPPKCGKSTLAKRFAKKYGMKIITRGIALRGVLKKFSWTNLAEVVQSHLQAGHTVPDEYVIRAVEMFSMDPCAVSQGLVFDGFPSNRKEVELLTFRGLQPMLVLDLKADLEFCLECLSYAADYHRCPPTFSREFFTNHYAAWKAEEENYRSWLKKYSKNVIKLDATKSKAYTWMRVEESVLGWFASLKLYFRECDYDKVHNLEFMCVSPYEFRKRQSEYEDFCPLCLMLENAFVASGPRPEAQGMVQFREHFYWICSNHLSTFHRDPLKYLPPNNTARLPEDRPRIVDGNVDLECICWGSRLQAEGYCLVTYVDSLPRRRIVPGKTTLGVSYRSKLYLFCTPECREKFLMYCSKYADAKPNVISSLPAINIWKLPDIGFLEQTVADILIQALNDISVLRPKIPGLSPAASAAVYIGVFLKIHNTSCGLQEIDIYEAVNERMMCHTQILKHATKNMQKKVNPFVHVPHYASNHRGDEMLQFSQVSSKTINMIKFRRTSLTQLLLDPDDDPDYSRYVKINDSRFDYLCKHFNPASAVPAHLNVVDIAGLVKGASTGQGLGNSFLSHISACDAMFHLCRAFDDDEIQHVEGDVDPVRDLEIISDELILKDLEFLQNNKSTVQKLLLRSKDKKLTDALDTFNKIEELLNNKKWIRHTDWTAGEIESLNKYLFLTSKPVIYLVNLSEKDYIRKKNKWLVKIKEWVDKNDPGAIIIPFSAAFEFKLLDLEADERTKYLEEVKVPSALDKIIMQGLKALQLQYFFTSGPDEVRAWMIQKGTKAPQAAGKIHTDFEKGFIMAEVMKFDDFQAEGSETAVRAAGKYRQQGRNYVVQDGDIIFFKFNAGAGLKDPKKK